jgi:hypothetical protein
MQLTNEGTGHNRTIRATGLKTPHGERTLEFKITHSGGACDAVILDQVIIPQIIAAFTSKKVLREEKAAKYRETEGKELVARIKQLLADRPEKVVAMRGLGYEPLALTTMGVPMIRIWVRQTPWMNKALLPLLKEELKPYEDAQIVVDFPDDRTTPTFKLQPSKPTAETPRPLSC